MKRRPGDFLVILDTKYVFREIICYQHAFFKQDLTQNVYDSNADGLKKRQSKVDIMLKLKT